MAETIKVEVAYALPDRQWLIAMEVPLGCTVGEAIRRSNIEVLAPIAEIDPKRVGIFYRPCSTDTILRDGDRVEIYRPLEKDPKEARRVRAAG
ncbi:MAG: RnfH family protein [Pseudomarimonas sp.]